MTTTEITINRLADKFALALHYQRQTSPQPCYIELDCRTGILSAEANPEIGNAVPMAVWYGHIRRYTIPCVTAGTANAIMDSIAPLAQRVVDGYESVWDGNNHVAQFSEDAQAAEDEIEQEIEDAYSDDNEISMVCADEWLDNIRDEATGKTDAQLAALAAEYEAEAAEQNIQLINALEQLTTWRDEAA